MPGKNRRSLSVAGVTYQRLQDAQREGKIGSISGFAEQLIAEKLDALGVPPVGRHELKPRKPKKRDENIPKIGGGVFSF